MKIESLTGQIFTLDELRQDIQAARDNGYDFAHDFAFTCATVDALISKLENMDTQIRQLERTLTAAVVYSKKLRTE